ncbi:MAG: transcription termination/antitermination NusG family protein [Steroidobacteraceae bacterium]
MRRWYLIHTKPAGEREAHLQLERQDYQTYLPRLIHTVRRRGLPRVQIAPLFPRYLFLNLDEGRQSLAPVHSTLGVAGVVRFGARFATVPEAIVRQLREREDPLTGLHTLQLPRLTPGTPVRVTAGVFAGLEGVFEREEGVDRVVVLLSLLGQERPVRFPAGLVSATC